MTKNELPKITKTKSGKYHASLNYYTPEGKRSTKSFTAADKSRLILDILAFHAEQKQTERFRGTGIVFRRHLGLFFDYIKMNFQIKIFSCFQQILIPSIFFQIFFSLFYFLLGKFIFKNGWMLGIVFHLLYLSID